MTRVRLLTLGMSVIYVWLMDVRSWPEFNQDKIPFIVSGPTMCQNFLYKMGGIPSGPGVVDGDICAMACSTSTLVNSLERESFMDGVTTCGIGATVSSMFLRSEAVNSDL